MKSIFEYENYQIIMFVLIITTLLLLTFNFSSLYNNQSNKLTGYSVLDKTESDNQITLSPNSNKLNILFSLTFGFLVSIALAFTVRITSK